MMLRLRTIAFVAVALYAVPALATISGSKHDFRSAGWGNGTICEPCHTPHDAYKDGDPAVAIYPLWNHASTAAAFTPYDSDTMQATPNGNAATMHWSSKLCLSCHDGTVALDSFGRNNDGTPHVGTNRMSNTAPGYVGTDLRSEHPVDFDYTVSEAGDTEIWASTEDRPGTPGTATIADYYLFDNIMGCASCHDVHNTTTYANMLRANPAGSVLCMDCHNK